MGSLHYTAYHRTLRAIVPLLTSHSIRGSEHLPRTGPCLLVSNHLSNVDPFCLIASIPRHFHGLAKSELYESWFVRKLIEPLEPIKVHRRGVDREALRQAEAYLRQGEMVFIFIEGTRSKTGATQEARAGAVFLAQRTGVPIVPIAIEGTNRIFGGQPPWYRRTKVRIVIGEPFVLEDLGVVTRQNRQEAAQRLMARIAELLATRHSPSPPVQRSA
ncbi:MAG TPA: lysophospholipid acyltransferase family protein [Herpetosiphonaceae bacterium]